MIQLDLNNDDMKALRECIHSQMEAAADFFSNANSSEFIHTAKSYIYWQNLDLP